MSGHPSTTGTDGENTQGTGEYIPCIVHPSPMNGTYNITFELQFSDGVRWILKVPMDGHGDSFQPVNQQALISEARTMQFIKSETTIPVPTIYAFDSSTNNILGLAFILMEKMEGVSAWQVWNSEEPVNKRERHRARIMQGIAAAMVQLNKFTSDQGGALTFDPDGKVAGIGKLKQADGIGIWNGDPEKDPRKQDRHVWATMPASTDPESFYLFTLDRLEAGMPTNANPSLKGTIRLLRLFIDWACKHIHITGKKFVLAHPDLDLQNVLVDEDGTVTGIIDWDSTAAVPREMGCALYPVWLMRDWVAESWDYSIVPGELESYRAMYAQFMEIEIERKFGGATELKDCGTLPRQESTLTRFSALFKHLELAGNFPLLTQQLVRDMLKACLTWTTNGWDGIDEDIDKETECESKPSTGGSGWGPATSRIHAESTHEDAPHSHNPSSEIKRETSDETANPNMPAVQANFSAARTPGNISTESQDRLPSGVVPDKQAQNSPSNAGLLQSVCKLCADVLKLSAEAFHETEVKKNKTDLLTYLKQHTCKEAKMVLTSWMAKIQAAVENIHCDKIQDNFSKEAINALIKEEGLHVDDAGVSKEVAAESSNRDEAANDRIPETPMIFPVEARKRSLSESIHEIETRRDQILAEAKEVKRAAKRAAKAAHEAEFREVWDCIGQQVEAWPIPLSKIRDHEWSIVNSIVNAINEAEKKEEEAALAAVENDGPEIQQPNSFKVPEESSGSESSEVSHTNAPVKNGKANNDTPLSTAPASSHKEIGDDEENIQQLNESEDAHEDPAKSDSVAETDPGRKIEDGSQKLMALIGAKATVQGSPQQALDGDDSKTSIPEITPEETGNRLNSLQKKNDCTSALPIPKAALDLSDFAPPKSKQHQEESLIMDPEKQTASEFTKEISYAKETGASKSVIDHALKEKAQQLKALLGVPFPEVGDDRCLDLEAGSSQQRHPALHDALCDPAILQAVKLNLHNAEAELLDAKPSVLQSPMIRHHHRALQDCGYASATYRQINLANASCRRNREACSPRNGIAVASASTADAPAYVLDGKTYTRNGKVFPRNRPCPCGSRPIFKRCCGRKSKASKPSTPLAQCQNIDIEHKSTKLIRNPRQFLDTASWKKWKPINSELSVAHIIDDSATLAFSSKGTHQNGSTLASNDHIEVIPTASTIRPPPGIPATATVENKVKWLALLPTASAQNKCMPTAASKGKVKNPKPYPAKPISPAASSKSSATNGGDKSPQQALSTAEDNHPSVQVVAHTPSPSLSSPLPLPSNPATAIRHHHIHSNQNTTTSNHPNNKIASKANEDEKDTFTDDGTFTHNTIINILGRDDRSLGEMRMLRLKMGFLSFMAGL